MFWFWSLVQYGPAFPTFDICGLWVVFEKKGIGHIIIKSIFDSEFSIKSFTSLQSVNEGAIVLTVFVLHILPPHGLELTQVELLNGTVGFLPEMTPACKQAVQISLSQTKILLTRLCLNCLESINPPIFFIYLLHHWLFHKSGLCYPSIDTELLMGCICRMSVNPLHYMGTEIKGSHSYHAKVIN